MYACYEINMFKPSRDTEQGAIVQN